MESLNTKGTYNLHLNSTWDTGSVKQKLDSVELWLISDVINSLVWALHYELKNQHYLCFVELRDTTIPELNSYAHYYDHVSDYTFENLTSDFTKIGVIS